MTAQASLTLPQTMYVYVKPDTVSASAAGRVIAVEVLRAGASWVTALPETSTGHRKWSVDDVFATPEAALREQVRRATYHAGLRREDLAWAEGRLAALEALLSSVGGVS